MNKTYYEVTRNLFDLIPEYSLPQFIKNCGKIGDTPDFKTFCLNCSIEKHPLWNSFEGNLNRERQFANCLYHMYSMTTCGIPFYEIEERLARELLKTSLNIDTYFLRAPFHEVCLVIPNDIFKIIDFETGIECPCTNIYVNLQDKNGYKSINIFATYIYFNSNGEAYDDITFYFNLNLTPGKIEDSFKNALNKMDWGKEDQLRLWGKSKTTEIFYFVFNVLIYLTTKDAEVTCMLPQVRDLEKKAIGLKNPKKKRIIKKFLNKTTRQKYRVVTAKGAFNEAKQKSDHAKRAVSKLNKLVKVEAHWHTFWVGKRIDENGNRQKGERALVKWIASYEKGHGDSEPQTRRKVV